MSILETLQTDHRQVKERLKNHPLYCGRQRAKRPFQAVQNRTDGA